MRNLPLLVALTLTIAPLAARAAAAGEAVVSTAPGESPAARSQDAEATYQALLAKAKAAAPDADWQGLRVAFAERPAFKVFSQNVAKKEMFDAVEAGDCAKGLAEARAVIAEAFVDADAHLVAAFCEEKLGGDPKDAALERDEGVGLLKSIETGDGLSPVQAFTVIDVDEEYSLLRARGLKIASQALIQQDGHAYDAITATDQTGASATYYFLIDRVLAAESAALKPGAVSEGGPPR